MVTHIWNVISPSVSNKGKNWLPSLLAKNRGLTSKKKLEEFLNPKFEQILEVKLTDVEKALKRISKAISSKEKVIIYSDYDADGICGTAILWETLHDLGADTLPYVPHRIKEGYGLSKEAISELAKKKVKLIITVDHGVAAVDQVDHAKDLGIDVIVTDHHILPKKLPKAVALVHSTDLCGAGVAWRLAYEISEKLKPSYRENLIEKLELASIATVADLVPLLGANRAIVKLGLEKISKTSRPGLQALIRETSISGQIGTFEIGHIIAPRINAMGRIEHAIDALRLICAKNQDQAASLARLLCKTNTKRQDLTSKIIQEAKVMVNGESPIGVISHPNWHEGIIGLVAARLMEIHNKPMIVISQGETFSKGSARSVAGFNIVEAISKSSNLVLNVGGHPMAAGFTIETCHIQSFSDSINYYAKGKLSVESLARKLSIECELQLDDISRNTLEIIDEFEPFGVGNREPLFLTKGMLVEDVRCVGQKNDHLKLQIDGFSAIGFNMGEFRSQIRPGYSVDAVYTLAEDRYNGNNAIQLKLRDLKIKS
ncbi:single-stranded-DNA-specific exonuclease RecJ [Candidatus Curtissbacteria bacterium RIFCSPLOWO2_01_FULL_41_28]|uniref:Single-stranded-DNA-specific exonuclease RecJ n=1 Tax=Candidatus Curtissbacteria bacterium RIFOXYA1_FULL_41_14 TaxID=1797737 RepID=A0A1F5HC53_9BACT|nr:MAG: Single-stranded-DNA-specific exonuclease RecJ [Microgenomates group bacterium GW2011_GWC1_40_35]KKR77340.1 MAG: Single-stranded-DNA-specific exonuclease RecJ [Candidatus Curtissbacteria bacterium GW2011_GWD1_40_8]KKS01871.1 MAG: Single-stranded-DNA-specific exonuclease RecJ [Candidatus Curtissbacteria bacterium GW2011_GWC2_41_21]OGD91614.1 MAG: single-stranded-DNA-specific exonuclease RecJ [Candidatus Curtissbacteria bacterium RIFCSPHIGHO2_12_FULL_41_13]OGD96690.1 MAG: single-stranded-D